jgi:AraC-like DNA-binding protein
LNFTANTYGREAFPALTAGANRLTIRASYRSGGPATVMGQPLPSALGFTVSADLIRGLIACASECGVPRARLADLIDQDASAASATQVPIRYSGEHILKLWDRILRETKDPVIGHRMALIAGVRTFGALGQILPRCATVLEAYRQTARYSALASQGGRVSVQTSAETLSICLEMRNLPPGDVSRTILLWGLTNLALIPPRLAGAAVRPKVISCTALAPKPADIRVLADRLPFSFGCAENRIEFDRGVAEIGIPTADTDLQSLLAETMDRHLAALGAEASFEQGMLTVLRSMMNGNMPTLASLSRRSGMSQRTLQRRLAESNTTFQHLLRQVLHETSEELLARQELTQGEIAFLLGYSEESAFSRAYKSWTGRPPGEVRSAQAVRLHV